MSARGGKPKEIDLGEELGDIAVKANGVRIEIHGDGSVAAYTKSDVDAYTDGAVHVHHAASGGDQPSAEVQPGDRMPDGTIFAGISPDTHEPMYTTPADAFLTMRWKEAIGYAGWLRLGAYGHRDWRVPTKA